jgi:hypothetical protein
MSVDEFALGQALSKETKSLSIISKNLHGLAVSIVEDKQSSAKRIHGHFLLAHGSQPIYAFAKIYMGAVDENCRLRRQLEHDINALITDVTSIECMTSLVRFEL